MPHNTLLTRLRAEYLEMPGLRLTLAQAQRLCGVERALCKAVLDALVADKFLCVKSGGAYARLTEGVISRPRPVKAGLRAEQRVATASPRWNGFALSTLQTSTTMPTTLRIVKPKPTFDLDGFLRSGGAGTTIVAYQPSEIAFSQGDASDSVMYLQEGAVKLSVLSRSGQEAVVAMLETGAFFGESALVGDSVRHETATTMTATTVLIIPKEQMIRLLHEQPEFSNRFIAHILARNIRIEEDVVDQLFNSSDKRLARALLLLAHYGKPGKAHRVLPPITQQTLADMVGTTRSRVNFFMNKFKKLGYIEYSGGLKVNDSLVKVILRDKRVGARPSKTG